MRLAETSNRLAGIQPTQGARLAGAVSASVISGYVAAALVWGNRSPTLRLCPFYLVTRRDCPLCGLTRGLGMIGEGRVGEALDRHGLALANAALLVVFAALRGGGPAGKRR